MDSASYVPYQAYKASAKTSICLTYPELYPVQTALPKSQLWLTIRNPDAASLGDLTS